MAKSEAAPFVDPPRPCRCGYCTDQKLREFIDGGLRAAREQGLPRPRKKTIRSYIERNPEITRKPSSDSLMSSWLGHCELWTDPWPGEGDG